MNWIFVSDWPARTACGPWTTSMTILYATLHLLVTLAYFALPAILVVRGVSLKPRPKAAIAVDSYFALFIVFCGLGHLLDFVSVAWVDYRVHIASVACTAAASWLCVWRLPILLFPSVPIDASRNRQ